MDDEHCFVRVRGRDVLRPKNLKQITCAIFPSANMSCTLTLHALHGSDNGRLTGLILLQHIVSTGKQSIGSEQIRMHVDVAASLIQLSINMEKKLKEIHFARVILNMFRRVFRNPDQMFHVAEHLCQALKRFVPCDHCKLYWVDNQKNEFVLFTKVVDFTQAFIQQKRFPLNEGILGEAFSNLRMNIATSRRYSNENDSRTAVEPKVDDQNGIIVSPGWTPKDETEKSTNFKNQLLFSIVGNGRIVAIVQVVRKSDAIGFTKVEKQMIKQLQPFFASCISQAKCLSRLHERNRRALLRREPFSLHALRIAEEDVLSLSHWNIRRCENFCADFSRPDYSAQNLTSHEVLKACLIIFADMGFITSFKIDRTTLARFLLALRRSHRNLPYHNWKHAFEMVHFCFILMEKIPEFHELLSDVELISLFIACMCHDIDYRGDSDQLQLVGENSIVRQ